MFVLEAGPFDCFENLRKWAGVPEEGEIERGLIPGVLSCLWCASVWTTFAMMGLWYITWFIPGVFAAMAIAVTAGRYVNNA